MDARVSEQTHIREERNCSSRYVIAEDQVSNYAVKVIQSQEMYRASGKRDT